MTDTTDATEGPERPARALTADVRLPERIDLGGEDGVHLRRITLDDVPTLHDAIVFSFAELHPWMPWCTEPVKIEEQREFVERGTKSWESAEAFNSGIFDADGTFLGTISLMDRVGPGGLEIGYWLRSDATGKGVMTRAAKMLTELGLGLPGIDRIEIHCDADNLRSAAVPRRLGFRLDREEDRPVTAPGESGRLQNWITP
jgi:RimJ/RimL family protein N-acetyltransferase